MSLAAVSVALDLLRAPPFEIWGVSFPLMDLIGAFRLSIVLRQIKKLKGGESSNTDTHVSPWITALILFGGEAILCSQLSLTPSFLIYPNVTLLFMGAQLLVNEIMLEPPPFRFSVELALAVFDAFGRALLLCDFAPSFIAKHPDPLVANSPLALLITSEVLTNGGFFFVNILNMLDPRGWRVDRTPPEALPWGWTAVDLWTAPAITALWASLTHWRDQPFWTHVHSNYLNSGELNEKPIAPWAHSDARSLCIVILVILFVCRTWWNMGPLPSFRFKKLEALGPVKPSSSTTSIELSSMPNNVRKRQNKHSRETSVTQDE